MDSHHENRFLNIQDNPRRHALRENITTLWVGFALGLHALQKNIARLSS